MNNKKSEIYKTTLALKQGGKLSAILFNYFVKIYLSIVSAKILVIN